MGRLRIEPVAIVGTLTARSVRFLLKRLDFRVHGVKGRQEAHRQGLDKSVNLIAVQLSLMFQFPVSQHRRPVLAKGRGTTTLSRLRSGPLRPQIVGDACHNNEQDQDLCGNGLDLSPTGT